MSKQRQRGYVLLSVLMGVALLAVATATAAPSIAFKVRRDREEELLHRASQYRRAIRLYTTKTGRYSSDAKTLVYSRYLRRAYKDPITGRDFRFIYMRDLSLALARASREGASSDSAGDSSRQNVEQAGAVNSGANANQESSDQPTGGIIFGVASRSKSRTIREFNHKNHYNDWLFFYDPQHYRGYEFVGPTPLNLPPLPEPPDPEHPRSSTEANGDQSPAAPEQ